MASTSIQHKSMIVEIRLDSGTGFAPVSFPPLERKEGESGRLSPDTKRGLHQKIHASLVRTIQTPFDAKQFHEAHKDLVKYFLPTVKPAKFRETVQWRINRVSSDGTLLEQTGWVNLKMVADKAKEYETSPFVFRSMVDESEMPKPSKTVEEFDFAWNTAPTPTAVKTPAK